MREIYNYYKANGIDTVVMAASFRNIGEIEALAGCDRMTISPRLLEELASDDGELPQKLSPENPASVPPIEINEAQFRWRMNEDAMATEKLAEGIRSFARDAQELQTRIKRALAGTCRKI